MSKGKNESVVERKQLPDGRSESLSGSPMMQHLLDALEAGTDIGHYGRLTFVMVGRYFLSDEEMVKLLAKQPDFDDTQARALVVEVRAHGYNPPRRAKILAWQGEQDFPIIPSPDDPDCGNVYDELKFPDEVYQHIEDYYEGKVEANQGR